MRTKSVIGKYLLSAALLGSVLPTANAFGAEASQNHEIRFTLNRTQGTIDGRDVTLETPPMLQNGVTMVPLRVIGETLGAVVQWEPSTRTAKLTKDGQSIELTVDQSIAALNGAQIRLEQPPVIAGGSTLVPLRFIAESFAQTVGYDQASQTISISSPFTGNPLTNPEAEKKPVPGKKKLERPTVDVLTYARSEIVDHIVLDQPHQYRGTTIYTEPNSDRVYMLGTASTSTNNGKLVIMAYDQKTGDPDKFETIIQIDKRFDAEYKNIYDSPTKVYHDSIYPQRLFYNEHNDQLFMVALALRYKGLLTLIYQIKPDPKLITYTLDDQHDTTYNFIDTVDGQTFYYSSTDEESIYSIQAGKERQRVISLPGGASQQLVSLVRDGKIYLLDMKNKTIRVLKENGALQDVAKVESADPILNAVAKDGYFYYVTQKGFYRVNITGAITDYALAEQFVYNGGLYDPKTGTNIIITKGSSKSERFPGRFEGGFRPGTEQNAGPLNLIAGIEFAVDNAGNIIVFDEKYGVLRRINVYAR